MNDFSIKRKKSMEMTSFQSKNSEKLVSFLAAMFLVFFWTVDIIMNVNEKIAQFGSKDFGNIFVLQI